MAEGAGRPNGAGAQAWRQQAQTDRGRARLLCQSEKLGLTIRSVAPNPIPFLDRAWRQRARHRLKSRIGNRGGLAMTKELLWLTLTIVLTGLMWVPYIIDRAMVRGLMGTMANPSRNDKAQSAWAQRLYFAHTNAVENLIIFAPLVLILDAQGHSTQGTVIACAVYFWSRLVHAVVYTMGVPVLRTLAFTVGFLAQAALVLAVFGKL